MNQRGASPINILLLIIMVVLVLMNVRLIDDVYSAATRHACYETQMKLDGVLWKTCNQQTREMADVLLAYTVKYPDRRSPVLVVLFRTPIDRPQEGRRVVVVDLQAETPPLNPLCPSHDDDSSKPVVDYWYALSKWHCMHNKYHSE